MFSLCHGGAFGGSLCVGSPSGRCERTETGCLPWVREVSHFGRSISPRTWTTHHNPFRAKMRFRCNMSDWVKQVQQRSQNQGMRTPCVTLLRQNGPNGRLSFGLIKQIVPLKRVPRTPYNANTPTRRHPKSGCLVCLWPLRRNKNRPLINQHRPQIARLHTSSSKSTPPNNAPSKTRPSIEQKCARTITLKSTPNSTPQDTQPSILRKSTSTPNRIPKPPPKLHAP